MAAPGRGDPSLKSFSAAAPHLSSSLSVSHCGESFWTGAPPRGPLGLDRAVTPTKSGVALDSVDPFPFAFR